MPRIANPVSPVRLRTAPPDHSGFECPVSAGWRGIFVSTQAFQAESFLKLRFCFTIERLCLSGEIGRHIGLKIRRFVNNGRTGSIPVSGTITLVSMPRYNAPFEIHVHGQVSLRADVTFDHLQDALRPLWKYAGARSLTDGAGSSYEDEPGIRFDAQDHLLQMCWTVAGDDDFRQTLDEVCMNLNELADTGAAIEITFYDADFDEEDSQPGTESRDDFIMLFVGPNPAAIMQVQRDLLVQDLINMMERHFDGAELGGVVAEVDKLFAQRFDALVSSLEIGRPPRGPGGGHGGGHGGGRKPRHLH